MLTPELREQIDEHGYLTIENALYPFGLDRVRAAFEAIQRQTEPAWAESIRNGTFKGRYGNGPDAHTMGDSHQYGTIFMDIAENLLVLPILKETVGPDVQTMEMVAHRHPAGADAHTGRHRDRPAWRHSQFMLKAKVFYFLNDQTPDMGCFSLVPGSHKRDANPSRTKYVGETLEQMPGLQKIVGKAGSAIIRNVLCWHSGLANTSPRDRRILIYGYMPFWVKKWGSTPPPQHIVDWADTPHRRQLMGIHAVEGRASWDRKDVPYLPEHAEIAAAKKF
ncbi:MAG: phytanoyl-CoA dioxygenase family protein [Caldilineaceae bacterium]|nr:phytanoyl-CoA dioxygenase family protein [Caldilineaceae bacterium]